MEHYTTRMARRGLWIGMLAASMIGAGPGRAQETPETLTRAEERCEQTTTKSVVRYAADATACLVDCNEGRLSAEPQDATSRRCGQFDPDPKTATCLDEARSAAEISLLRGCAGAACPECYGQASCRSVHQGDLFVTDTFVHDAMSLLYCDDSASPDGLSPAESRCQRSLASAGARFVSALAACSARCHHKSWRQSGDPALCDQIDLPTTDPQMQRCVDGARRRFGLQCGRRCGDAPDCLPIDCSGARLLLEYELSTGTDAYCVDVARCGDGFVSGTEQCDSARYPSGCADGQFCNDGCSCEPYPVCGDGRVSGWETCDPTATPTGCGPGQRCDSCGYCATPTCGDGVRDPGEACDPWAWSNDCPGGQTCNADCSCGAPADTCALAFLLPAEGGTARGVAGVSGTSGTCGGAGPELVFAWTPSSSGIATITTVGDDPWFDTVLYVRAADCRAGGEIACNDDEPALGVGSRVTPLVTAGTTYYIFADSYGRSGGEWLTLTVTPPASAPSADQH